MVVADLVRETSAITILGVFPCGNDAVAHDKEHAVLDENLWQRLGDGNGLLHSSELIDTLVAIRRPVGVVR